MYAKFLGNEPSIVCMNFSTTNELLLSAVHQIILMAAEGSSLGETDVSTQNSKITICIQMKQAVGQMNLFSM
jgi:hypothetical protein